MDAGFLKQKFDVALDYEAYVRTGNEEQQRRWRAVEPLLTFTPQQSELIGGFTREMNVLCISGIWCGDCVQQGPMLQAIAKQNDRAVRLRFVDRDAHKDLSEQFKINGGYRVPTVIFMAEDFEFCGVLGDRTISRYRAFASRQLGASCPVGISPPDQNEALAALADWLEEFERIQLMLRLSARLRQKHSD